MILKWIFAQFTRLQVYMFRRSGGNMVMRGMPLLLLTSTGRKTGQQHLTPVMYLRDGDNYVITASNGGSDKYPSWFWNLQAHPQTVIEAGGQTVNVTAHQANPEEKGCLWPQLVKQAPFFDDYRKKTTRDIPMVILAPANGQTGSVSNTEKTA